LAPQYGAPEARREAADVVVDAAREGERRERLGAAPDADRRLRDHELVAQLAHEHVGQVGGVGGEHERARPAVQLVGDRRVLLAVPDHLDQLALEALDLSRSISICRSCRDTARWPCGLASCTVASSSAWRSKKPGLVAR
jgi:hypothetical protein